MNWDFLQSVTVIQILSGGQKQRVVVAVSMICGKEVLVFDEPTSGLDYDSMEQVSGLIRELSKDKVILLLRMIMNLSARLVPG